MIVCAGRGGASKRRSESQLERDAAGGRRKARPGGMDEHRAAAAGDARPRVVVELDDEIVERVGARQPVGRAAGGTLTGRL